MTFRSRRWLACFLVVACCQAMAAERSWRMATTPHYRLLSQLNDRDTSSWMRQFDQFLLSTSDVLKLDLRLLPPLTVVIFERDKDYAPYKPTRPNGRTATNVAGQFVRRPTWSLIGMAYDASNEESRRIIYHEATHWLMSVDQARQPAWFSEGIAEMLSTFERRGSNVNWAQPINGYLILLNRVGDMELESFLVQPAAIFDRDERTARFYAQSWAFTHFLMSSGRRELLLRFLETFKTQSGEATVKDVFGPSLKDLERQFHLYVGQRNWNYMVQAVKPAPEPPPLQPASPALVDASLGFLALGAGRHELARKHAEKAIALDANAPDGHGVLAYLALEESDFDKAVTHAEAALQSGSKDSDLFMLLGDSYVSGANSQKPNASQLRVNMYENAINLNPRRIDTYDRLVEALFPIAKPRDEDARFLNVGLRMYPGEDWLRVGIAVVDYRLGRREVATATLDTVLRPESTLGESQRTFAAGLRRRWFADAMTSEIDAALGKNNFAEARAVAGRYRERLGADPEAASFLDDIDKELEQKELVARFEASLRARQNPDAKVLAEQLLKRTDLPEDLRSYVERRLRGVK